MKDIRCLNCFKLLLKAAFTGTIEIKCPKCKHVNSINK